MFWGFSYLFVGGLVGWVYGIRAAWQDKNDGADDQDAIEHGGFIAIVSALTWPFIVYGNIVGWVGVQARKSWLESE